MQGKIDKRFRRGKESAHWKGGKIITVMGYIKIKMQSHPRLPNDRYMLEHILIAEKALGKLLPKNARIHHYGKIDDNTKLVICENHEYHFLLHQRTRALHACGHADWRKCAFCKQYDKIDNLYVRGSLSYHRTCHAEYNRKYRRIKKEESLNATKTTCLA